MRHDGAGARLANASDRAASRTGRERGGGDLLVGRSRRARMSFGLGGMARELIDLLAEDPWLPGEAEQKDGRDRLACLSQAARGPALAHHL